MPTGKQVPSAAPRVKPQLPQPGWLAISTGIQGSLDMQTGTCFRVSVRLVLLIFATVMAGNLALAQVVITPSKPAVVNPGGTFKFAANVPVAWSMLPGSKGTIDSDGTYHAPANATAQQSVGGC